MALPLTEWNTEEKERRERQAQAVIERRFGVFVLDAGLLVTFFRSKRGAPELKERLTFDGIPWDALLLSVHVDTYRPTTIMLTLASMDFAPMSEGGMPTPAYVTTAQYFGDAVP